MFRSLISELKSKVLIYFKSFSLVSSCINEFHKFFPSKFSFRFPFHSNFRSVPFCVLVTPMSDLPLSATRALVWVRRGVGARWETVRNLSQCVGASPSQGPKEELQNKHIPTLSLFCTPTRLLK